MAQTWRSQRGGGEARAIPPLNAAALERLALRYVERYATTRARLRIYLQRKLRERGWDGAEPPPIEALVMRFRELGYVDDASFAATRSAGLTRRGFGPRRVSASLRAAGISDDDAEDARAVARDGAWQAALIFARRKRIGPYAAVAPDRAGREKALGAMLRAGHDLRTARRIIEAPPGIVPEPDDH